MPRKPIDYSNTHFYKIVCKDVNIKECYVGHTTDFTKRKNQHKKDCNDEKRKNHNITVYKYIRENGGWNNWEMISIDTISCKDSLEARKVEREFTEKLQANLNIYVPYKSEEEKAEEKKEFDRQYYSTHKEEMNKKSSQRYEEHKEEEKEKRKQRYENNKEATLEQNKKWRDEHKQEQKEYFNYYRENNKEKISLRAKEIIECECGFTYTRHHKSRHLKTKRHQAYLKQKD